MTDRDVTILVVDDDPSMLTFLGNALKKLGFNVHTASSGPTALDALRRQPTDLVLTDIMMGPMDGLTLLRRIKSDRPEIGVVVITGLSSEDMAIEALRAGAIDYLKKPVHVEMLKRVIKNAIQVQTALNRRNIDVEALVSEEKIMEFPNDPERIPGVVRQLTIGAPKYLDIGRCREISVALYEIILNAMEHGNLEITPEEKSEHLHAGDYLNFVEKRRADPTLSVRKVSVHYRMDPSGLYYTVRDEGQGFDWARHFRAPTEQEARLSVHGRGLILSSFYVDRIEFNEIGNAVRLAVFAPTKGEC